MDKLTKIVLTVIAVNLTILTVKSLDFIPKAYANEPENKVEFMSNMKYGLVPINDDGTISVKLTGNEEIDVNIVGVDTNDELDVNIDEIGGKTVSFGGPIPVEID